MICSESEIDLTKFFDFMKLCKLSNKKPVKRELIDKWINNCISFTGISKQLFLVGDNKSIDGCSIRNVKKFLSDMSFFITCINEEFDVQFYKTNKNKSKDNEVWKDSRMIKSYKIKISDCIKKLIEDNKIKICLHEMDTFMKAYHVFKNYTSAVRFLYHYRHIRITVPQLKKIIEEY